ncbi:hypothetical protein QJS04_geneDACA018291 [Acorus gramineus]|uniref:Transposase-associated domain-containing protein n=1 Tax=Acorus gramineus TaxID=55184 RepID=A0AAV9BB04_ACOGR|nr:hypothetical protein QJS04_geneDACA018291 [Acorus gramineus]
MDKIWIHLQNRISQTYINGLEKFLDFAYTNKPLNSMIDCPCKQCCNRYLVKRDVAREHIIIKGFFCQITRFGLVMGNVMCMFMEMKTLKLEQNQL